MHKLKTVTYYIRETYGQVRRYPVNDFAALVVSLTRQTTLTDNDIRLLDSYGVTCELVPETRLAPSHG